MHSAKYEKVKFYYDTDRWSAEKVHDAVVKGWITQEEYNEIVDAVVSRLSNRSVRETPQEETTEEPTEDDVR